MQAKREQLVLTLAWGEAPWDPVIREQVVDRSAALGEAGFDARVVIGVTETAAASLEPSNHYELAVGEGFADLVRLARRLMSDPGERERHPVIICRGALVALAAVIARGSIRSGSWSVVHDARSWYEGEGRDQADGRARVGTKRLIERLAYRRSDHSVVVSEALLGIALGSGAGAGALSVIPQWQRPRSAAGVPAELELPEAEVIYVGNSWYAHQPEALIRPLLGELASRLPERSFGWLDASADGEAQQLAANLWRRRVEPELVAAYLAGASVGLLIREPTATNAVAAPTKAAQYLAAGCGIVTTPHPVSAAQLCLASGRGRVVSGLDPGDWAEAIEQMLAAVPTGELHWGERVIESWAALLDDLFHARNAPKQG